MDRGPVRSRSRDANDAAQKLLRHLAAVPAGPLLKGPAHAGKIPRVFVRLKPLGQILRAKDPGVVGEPAGGIRPRVGIDQLPRRGDSHRRVGGVEGEFLRVLHHLKQVRVRAIELRRAIHSEGVIPDDPTAAGQPMLPLKHDLQLGGVFVADGQPKRAVGPQARTTARSSGGSIRDTCPLRVDLRRRRNRSRC